MALWMLVSAVAARASTVRRDEPVTDSEPDTTVYLDQCDLCIEYFGEDMEVTSNDFDHLSTCCLEEGAEILVPKQQDPSAMRRDWVPIVFTNAQAADVANAEVYVERGDVESQVSYANGHPDFNKEAMAIDYQIKDYDPCLKHKGLPIPGKRYRSCASVTEKIMIQGNWRDVYWGKRMRDAADAWKAKQAAPLSPELDDGPAAKSPKAPEPLPAPTTRREHTESPKKPPLGSAENPVHAVPVDSSAHDVQSDIDRFVLAANSGPGRSRGVLAQHLGLGLDEQNLHGLLARHLGLGGTGHVFDMHPVDGHEPVNMQRHWPADMQVHDSLVKGHKLEIDRG